MSRHVDRELARARVRGLARRKATLSTALGPLVRSLIATLARTPSGANVTFDVQIDEVLTVPMDRADLAEVLGNILDNAARHATSRVRISAHQASGGPSIVIEDDGPGIAPSARGDAIERGVRFDEREGGSGLGLAIVQDVLEAYGWQIKISTSDHLSGAVVTILPMPQRSPSPTQAAVPKDPFSRST